ncbi:MAG TPA: hypothetical protein VFJ13_10720 [Paracoccaceae bacterium]|nr:hypothetical protein [Paracoccaceae bacterium]
MNLMEMATASSMRGWKADGKDRLVKVCGPAGAQATEKYKSVMGYVTQEKYIYGKTSREIETLLGLRPFELRTIAYVFSLARLPRLGEFEYKFSLAFPDGQVFGEPQFDRMLEAREDYLEGRNLTDRSFTPVAQYYPPGSGMIPQWKIKEPVPLGELLATVTEVFPFARDNGSLKPYTPHNRHPIR